MRKLLLTVLVASGCAPVFLPPHPHMRSRIYVPHPAPVVVVPRPAPPPVIVMPPRPRVTVHGYWR